MPSFRQYDVPVDVDVDVDIEVDEFLEECDEDEIQEIISYINKHHRHFISLNHNDNLFDDMWNKVITKLANSRLQMSQEDIAIIEAIAKKY